MEVLIEWLIPYLISNIIFGLSIVAAIRRPMLTRVFFALFFLWAACFNTYTSVFSPQTYLTYARLDALPAYSRFINGFFSKHITSIVLAIATGQLLISAGLALKGAWVRLACAGGILFGLAIAPLGVGSGFPSTVSMAIAFLFLLKKRRHLYIWKWKQYKPAYQDILV